MPLVKTGFTSAIHTSDIFGGGRVAVVFDLPSLRFGVCGSGRMRDEERLTAESSILSAKGMLGDSAFVIEMVGVLPTTCGKGP